MANENAHGEKLVYLREWREKKGLAQMVVAKKLGIAPSTYNRWENGNSSVDVPALYLVANLLECAPEDLLKDPQQVTKGVVKLQAYNQPEFEFPVAYMEYITGKSDFSGFAAIKIVGDTMEPTANPGDQVMIDSNRTNLSEPGLYAFKFGDNAEIRRVAPSINGNMVTISCDNPKYGAAESVDRNNIAPLGRVIWIGKKV